MLGVCSVLRRWSTVRRRCRRSRRPRPCRPRRCSRRSGRGALGLDASGGGGAVRDVRSERGALPSRQRLVGAGSAGEQPVAVAPARGGGRSRRSWARALDAADHRGDRRRVGRSRVRQRVPGRAGRGGDALRDPPRRHRRSATATPTSVEVTHLVPGDIVHLDVGSIVPADVRLLAASNLECDESILTGESVPAAKSPDPVAAARRSPICRRACSWAPSCTRARPTPSSSPPDGSPSSGGSRSASASGTPRPSSSSGSPASPGCSPRSAACSA